MSRELEGRMHDVRGAPWRAAARRAELPVPLAHPPAPLAHPLRDAAVLAAEQADLDHATNGLLRRHPELSTAAPARPWQTWTLLLLPPAFVATFVAAPEQAIFILAAVLVLPFFCVVALRTAALWHTLRGRQAGEALPPRARAPDSTPLPRYTLLVPLYDEADVIPDLLAALAAIDYPPDKLEVLLILEITDHTTRAAVAAAALPTHVTVVVVPDGAPRTKPRALNYALRRATGQLVVVYDAEDVPEPDQLRRAARAFEKTPGLGCVQARLNVLNDREGWLTRQFAIEYTVLFDCLLPTLERLGLPVPLGGTSNHFSRAVLEEVGAWDPFNVTEDADLGIRLARMGWTVRVLPSTTWEEAPPRFHIWLKQRTRWLKGWMQTYMVHMRDPAHTARDLGAMRFFGLQVLMGGLILSTLVHPWFYVVAVAELAYGPLLASEHSTLADAVTVVGFVNLVLGYVSGVTLGCVAVAGRGRHGLAAWALLMPAYWLLISLAAYRALIQLATSPYRWEKTKHRPRTAFTAPSPPAA
ncbi:MAG: glycosyltransferase [Hyphomicrobium sp.]|uniref:glycosyltransferase n=1 Tax=Hyphomicrobium sp. TaxID=82 RepID=UPI003D0D701F